MRKLDVDDAVFAIALQRYIITRWRYGEQVTGLAAARIAELARERGLAPQLQLDVLGFSAAGFAVGPLAREALLAALRVVRLHERGREVHQFCNEYVHLSVAQLEQAYCSVGG